MFDKLLNDGRKGRKSGKGFYTYKGKKKTVDSSVYSVLDLKPEATMSEKDIAIRCVLPMLNEAVRCLDEGIIRSLVTVTLVLFSVSVSLHSWAVHSATWIHWALRKLSI
ncbi:enoyl-CoA hydratase [Vibrio maritimus]|uniref:Enoyl-CoA hydratase n=1 Tax=Vibrio maritimus TaxID=990268 RepID=A0A090TF47_9VIBR|nr:enoyl-CoA hydratase [Vibrio maritimus]